MTVDEAYLKRAINDPMAEAPLGYPPAMPELALSEAETLGFCGSPGAELVSGHGPASIPVMQNVRLMAVLLPLFVFVSCQTSLEPSGFLGESEARMGKNAKLPFSRSWKNPGVDLRSYQNIAVRPMRTEDLRELKGLARVNLPGTDEKVRKAAAELAETGTLFLKEELGRSPNRRVFITAKPPQKEGWMVVETNLVELDPGRPSFQVLNLVPFTGFLNGHAIGIEGRLRDGHSGEVLFAFSDLEMTDSSLVDVQRFHEFGVQRRELARWARHLRQVVESDGSALVRDAFPIQVVNW